MSTSATNPSATNPSTGSPAPGRRVLDAVGQGCGAAAGAAALAMVWVFALTSGVRGAFGRTGPRTPPGQG